ncbi:MAG TPA: alanine--tRNA ligase, partial [Candidatus Acidoferrales bacterium]|nr:alanine--tRNA ligase [Candidatus Acidoferrales bacterium]
MATIQIAQREGKLAPPHDAETTGRIAGAECVCDNEALRLPAAGGIRTCEDRLNAEELKWPGNKIRATFLKFFEERGHKIVRSSSLVPANDPTLLFTNAGMNQFKDVFLGLEQRDYKRATTCQKCVRAGGKHNDLENVGFTNRHHTFFEMLGNFSFGDYFKKDAIAFAWELITSPQWFGIPVEKLYFTVFGGHDNLQPDHDAAKLWIQTGAPKDRVIEIPGLKENFWAMGDTGPCGPCSEIHYDMGPAASDQGHADCKFPCDCGRYVEIWNLVFMQFNRDASGKLNPLPKPSVDTGMGLERVAAVLQNKISNFDTDLFVPLISRASALIGIDPGKNPSISPSLRIISDHARAATFLIADGVQPSNEGRGYTLRKIMRRAIRHGQMWGYKQPFLFRMAQAVCDLMSEAYPELPEVIARVSETILTEENKFGRTVEIASEKLGELITSARGNAKKACLDAFLQTEGVGFDREFAQRDIDYILPNDAPDPWRAHGATLVVDESALKMRKYFEQHYRPELSGAKAFSLYDTFGLPRDFIEDAARDAGVQVDWDDFDHAMEEQQQRSKASWKGAHKEAARPVYTKLANTFTTEPDFYFGTTTRDCHIEAIVTKNGQVNELKAGEEAEIVLDRTTIYSESGGQVADTGALYDNDMSLAVAEVRGAYYPVAGLIAHRIVAKEDLVVGDRVSTVADAARRARIMRNHTGTHLMNAALRNILGTHVKQAGSLNAPDHLRFDFSHFAQLAPEELQEIELQVNEEILRDLP